MDELIRKQDAIAATMETVFVEYEDTAPRKEESIILQTKAAIRERIEALPPTLAIPIEWIEKYMRTIKSGSFAYFADPAWTIKMMLETWQDEQEAEHDLMD